MIMRIDKGLRSTDLRLAGTIYVTPLTFIMPLIRTSLRSDVAMVVKVEQKRIKIITSLKFCLKRIQTFLRNDRKP